jgi:hypothetical protein
VIPGTAATAIYTLPYAQDICMNVSSVLLLTQHTHVFLRSCTHSIMAFVQNYGSCLSWEDGDNRYQTPQPDFTCIAPIVTAAGAFPFSIGAYQAGNFLTWAAVTPIVKSDCVSVDEHITSIL